MPKKPSCFRKKPTKSESGAPGCALSVYHDEVFILTGAIEMDKRCRNSDRKEGVYANAF